MSDTSSNSLLNTLSTSAKKAKDTTVRAVSEETKQMADNTSNQIAPAPLTEEQKQNTRQEVEGMYGGKEAVMDPSKFAQKQADDQKKTAGMIDQILGQLLGPSSKMYDDRKKRVASEHKAEAERLGQEKTDEKQKEAQRKQIQEEEEKRKKEEEKAKLEQQIEAPAGKTTGMSFGRKKSAPKMQKPPSAETRGGKGNRE